MAIRTAGPDTHAKLTLWNRTSQHRLDLEPGGGFLNEEEVKLYIEQLQPFLAGGTCITVEIETATTFEVKDD
jgi:hypothetical protein